MDSKLVSWSNFKVFSLIIWLISILSLETCPLICLKVNGRKMDHLVISSSKYLRRYQQNLVCEVTDHSHNSVKKFLIQCSWFFLCGNVCILTIIHVKTLVIMDFVGHISVVASFVHFARYLFPKLTCPKSEIVGRSLLYNVFVPIFRIYL